MKSYYTFLVLIFTVFMSASCSLFDPEETVPSFIYLENFSMSTDSLSEGSAGENFTEGWVYVNDQLLGIFDKKTEIPYLGEGTVEVSVHASVKDFGIAELRVRYPFTQVYSTTLKLEKEFTDTINPNFTYYDNLDFWHENFENAGFNFVKLPGSDNMDLFEGSNVYEGMGSGIMKLEAGETYMGSKMIEGIPLPVGEAVFVELDYKCDNSFTIGIISDYPSNDDEYTDAIISINPTNYSVNNGWNKLYFELAPAIASRANAVGYKLYFEFYNSNSATSSEVLLDNIKIIY